MAVGALGSMVIKLAADVVQFTGPIDQAEARVGAFKKAALSHFDDLNAGIQSRMTGIASAMAAGFSLAAFAGQIKAVAEFRAKLDDLADSGLGSVETLSKLATASKLSGVGFDTISQGAQKMIRGLAGADEETSRAGDALKRLGVNARDSTGALREPADLMLELAKKLNTYKDGADKAAVVQAALGKGAASLLPFFKDLAEYGDLQVKVTSRQAAEAENFTKALTRMQIALEGSGKKIAGEMIPAATALFQTIEQLAKSANTTGGELDKMVKSGQLQDWAAQSVQVLAFVVNGFDGLARFAKLSGEWIGFVAAQFTVAGQAALGALQIMAGPTFWAQGIRNMAAAVDKLQANKAAFKDTATGILEAKLAGDQLAETFQRNYTVVKLLGQAMAGEFGDQVSRRFKETKSQIDSSGLGAKVAAAGVDEYAKAVERLTKEFQQLSVQTDNGDKLTKGQQEFLAIATSPAWATFTQKQRQNIANMVEAITTMEKEAEARREALKLQEEATKIIEREREERERALRTLEEQNDRLRDEVAFFGETESARAMRVARMKEELVAQIALVDTSSEYYLALRREAEAMRERAELVTAREVLQTQAKLQADQLREYERFGERVADIGASSFMTIWDRGRDGFRSLLADLWTWFKQLMARIAAEKIVVPIVLNSIGLGGLTGTANAISAGGTLANVGGLLGSGLNALGFNAASQFIGGFTGAIQGPALAGSALAAGQTAAAYIFNPITAAVAAVAALALAFKDAGENWKARLAYGGAATAYSSQQTFGTVGFANIAGNDATNRAIQAFFDSFKGIDQKILATLKDGQADAIKAAVNSLGQSAREFAFPKGDSTAAAQLTLQATQEYYGAVFSALGADFAGFADKIKGWTGTVEDLLTAIGDMTAAMQLVSSGVIRGLTIPVLQEWQREGETLAQTARRVATNFATLVDKFAPTGEKLRLATEPFTTAVASLGATLPATREGFYNWITSLKLGDQAQRDLYRTITENYLPAADAYYQAIEQQAQAQQQAAQQIQSAREALMTDADKLAAAQGLLTLYGITSRASLDKFLDGINATDPAGQAAAGAAMALVNAWKLTHQAGLQLAATNNKGRQSVDSLTAGVDQLSTAATEVAQAVGDAMAEVRGYIDNAISGRNSLISRYQQGNDLTAARNTIEEIRGTFALMGVQMPATGAAISAMAAGLDATTPYGIAMVSMLTRLADAMDLVNNAGAAVDDFFAGLMTPTEQLDNAYALLSENGLTGAESLQQLRAALQAMSTAGGDNLDVLKRIYEAWKLVNSTSDATGGGGGGTNPQDGPTTDTPPFIAAPPALLTTWTQFQQIIGAILTDAQRMANARDVLAQFGVAADATAEQLQARLRDLVLANASPEELQSVVQAWQYVTEASRRAADVAAQAAADALKAQQELADKQVQAVAAALAAIARIADARSGIQSTIAGVLRGRSGYDYGAFLAANVGSARAAFGAASGIDAQLTAAGKLQTALQSRYDYEMQALAAQRDAQVAAGRAAVSSAQALGEAFKGLGDYARSLLTSELSPLSAEQQIAAASGNYRALLAKAQGGDANAAQALQQAAQDYLSTAGAYYARNNPAYLAIFGDVQGNLSALGSRGDSQLAYAQSAAASLDALANALTPQMIELQDRYVQDLQDLDTSLGDLQDQQEQAAQDAAAQWADIAATNQDIAASTASMAKDIKDLLAAALAAHGVTAAAAASSAATADNTAATAAGLAAAGDAALLNTAPVGAPAL